MKKNVVVLMPQMKRGILVLVALLLAATALFYYVRDDEGAPLLPTYGTLYWGGAGLHGNYIDKHLHAFKAAGVSNVYAGKTNTGPGYGINLGPHLNRIVDAIRVLWIRRSDDDPWLVTGMSRPSTQLNFIGYSYGSLLAAQTAKYYASRGKRVDHLVLIGSPINRDFLLELGRTPNLARVIVIDLTEHADPIAAGMPLSDLIASLPTVGAQMFRNNGEGHFYYSADIEDLGARIEKLARQLALEGVR